MAPRSGQWTPCSVTCYILGLALLGINAGISSYAAWCLNNVVQPRLDAEDPLGQSPHGKRVLGFLLSTAIISALLFLGTLLKIGCNVYGLRLSNLRSERKDMSLVDLCTDFCGVAAYESYGAVSLWYALGWQWIFRGQDLETYCHMLVVLLGVHVSLFGIITVAMAMLIGLLSHAKLTLHYAFKAPEAIQLTQLRGNERNA
ncbi:hypothetical protein SCARD494_10700 [Seiridium cardinale]